MIKSKTIKDIPAISMACRYVCVYDRRVKGEKNLKKQKQNDGSISLSIYLYYLYDPNRSYCSPLFEVGDEKKGMEGGKMINN